MTPKVISTSTVSNALAGNPNSNQIFYSSSLVHEKPNLIQANGSLLGVNLASTPAITQNSVHPASSADA